MNNKYTEAKRTESGAITVSDLAEWLKSLPEEFQSAPVESAPPGSDMPLSLKRVVAYRRKNGEGIGVAVNSMGTHFPFDDSLAWEHVLS